MAIKPIIGFELPVDYNGCNLLAAVEKGTKTQELILVCEETRKIRKGFRIWLNDEANNKKVEVLTTQDVQIFETFDTFFNAAKPVVTLCPEMDDRQAYRFYFQLSAKFYDNSEGFGLLKFQLPTKVNSVASKVISSNRNPKNREESKAPIENSSMFSQAPLQKRKTVQQPDIRAENCQLPSDRSSFSTVKKSVGPRKNTAS